MDIAGMSVALSNQQLRMQASLATMVQAKQFSEEMGKQFIEMVEESVPNIHPTLGKSIDISV